MFYDPRNKNAPTAMNDKIKISNFGKHPFFRDVNNFGSRPVWDRTPMGVPVPTLC
jgi:hypothetical protein